jgi:carotenoid cleavage dioxygenase
MVHAVRLRGGKASYNNRFVQTARLRQEKACGYEAFAKFGRLRGLRGLASISLDLLKKRLGVLDASHGLGTANTALAFHAGRLLALHEGDLPYQLRLACNGLVSTVRRVSFGGASRHSFTAHPKIDPETGELFAFGYQLDKAPFLHYLRCDATGAVAADFEVPLPSPVMMHDFAVTARHVIFVDAPLHFAPEAMVRRGTLPFVFDKAKAIRFGVLDRYAPDAAGIRWFEGPTGMIFHVANAWEAGEGRVELHACIMNDFSLDAFTAASGDAEPYLTRVCLDLRSGEATAERVSPLAGDFPVVPAALAGRRTRYAYVATLTTGGEGQPRFDGVAKIRLAAAGPGEAVAGRVLHGEGRVGGEAFFVPKEGGREEDDGYLMTIVYDEGAGRSELVIYDAASMAAAPVARVALPRRVPHGFHSTWVPQSQMDAQV